MQCVHVSTAVHSVEENWIKLEQEMEVRKLRCIKHAVGRQ